MACHCGVWDLYICKTLGVKVLNCPRITTVTVYNRLVWFNKETVGKHVAFSAVKLCSEVAS